MVSTPVDSTTRHRHVYTLKDIQVYFYRDSSNPGVAPNSWTSGNEMKAIATGFTLDMKQDASLVHGQGTRFPVGTRVGEVSYEWTIDGLYTNDTYSTFGAAYKLGQLIEADIGFFCMKVVCGAEERILTYCTLTGSPVKVSEGECVTINLTGIAEFVTST